MLLKKGKYKDSTYIYVTIPKNSCKESKTGKSYQYTINCDSEIIVNDVKVKAGDFFAQVDLQDQNK